MFAAVVAQHYVVEVYDDFVTAGNTAVFRCHIPGFIKDFVDVVSWIQDSSTLIQANDLPGQSLASHAIHALQTFFIIIFFLSNKTETYIVLNYILSFCFFVFFTIISKLYFSLSTSAIIQFSSFSLSSNSWMHSFGDRLIQLCFFYILGDRFSVFSTGELHIRRVQQSDALKTYRCQVRHRLTGETLISSSVGRLYVTGRTNIWLAFASDSNIIDILKTLFNCFLFCSDNISLISVNH